MNEPGAHFDDRFWALADHSRVMHLAVEAMYAVGTEAA
jgi:hypothetical protein